MRTPTSTKPPGRASEASPPKAPPKGQPSGAAPRTLSLEEARARVERMVQRYVARGPYRLYPDPARVEAVLDGLARNLAQYGRMYCPCVPIEKALEAGRHYVCPCVPHHEDIARQGYCDCALFVSENFLKQEEERRRGRQDR